MDRHWNGHSSAISERIDRAINALFDFFPFYCRLLANKARTWQSSDLYSYSHRLSWAAPSNSFTNQIEAKRHAGFSLLDLTRSNPTEVLQNYPHTAISDAYGQVRDFTYLPESAGRLDARFAISAYYKERGFAVPSERIFLTASTSEAYALLFKLFCDPGDEVLTPIPSYPLFEYLAALESVRMVPYRLLYDGSWHIDFHHLRQQISPQTRAIVIVNPNNPTGSLLKNSEADELLEIAQAYKLPIISDEVFFDYPLRSTPNALTTFTAQNQALTFSLNGLSKAAGMPQMKLGWVAVSGPAHQLETPVRNLELVLDTYLSVGTPVQRVLPELLKIGDGIRKQLTERTQRNLAILERLLFNTSATVLHAEAGWSAIIRLPNVLSEDTWTTRILEEGNVIVQPGYFFDMPHDAYVVVSLITPEAEFETGVTRIRHLLEQA